MKRFIKLSVLFLLTAAVPYVLLMWLLGDMGWVRTARTEMASRGFLNTRIKDIANYHDVDVLFLGSSHCYRTFDTRFYRSHGISCFNLGSSNQTPVQTRVLLNAYLDSLSPRYVVFEVHPDIMDQDGIESAVDLLINMPLTCEATRMAWKALCYIQSEDMPSAGTLHRRQHNGRCRLHPGRICRDTEKVL